MSTTSTAAIAKRVEELAGEVAAEFGAEVYDVEVRRNGADGTIRLLVDKVGKPAPGEGITIGEVTKIAKQVGYVLDTEDVVGFSYRFEVSSPGVERPLRTPRHVEMNVGERVRLVLSEELEGGKRVVEGTLSAFEDGVLTVTDGSGTETKVAFDAIRKGRTVFEFGSNKQRKK